MEEIKTLAHTDPDDLFTAFNEAFSDYARSWNRQEFETMLQRRGYNALLSFGAFDKGKLVSFTLNGTGSYKGINTVYDTGTGTLKEYRSKGLAPKIFQTALPHLKEAGFSQYLLEVLKSNTKAVSVYTNLEFKMSRELNYFTGQPGQLKLKQRGLPANYQLKETAIDPARMQALCDFLPAWQNNFEAIQRSPADFKTVSVFYGAELAGYGITEPSSGDITQLAVDKRHRRKGLGMHLVRTLAGYTSSSILKCINTDAACGSMTAFLTACNLPLCGTQFEMTRKL